MDYERISTKIFNDATEASASVAAEIATLIREKQAQYRPVALGLATGSSPKMVYKKLIELHKNEGLSFKNVYTFNLDEYFPMEPTAAQSYVRFMNENLFDHIDIPREQIHIPDGTLALDQLQDFCRNYEAKIEAMGGLDFQLLGIGRNGHIGFNEPGSLANSKTRLMTLDLSTRADASAEFGGLNKVSRKAITLGIQKILDAKRVVLLAWGEHKALNVARAIEGPVTAEVPASYLQMHQNASFVIDHAAADQLTRIRTPWMVDNVVWDKATTKKAVTQLSLILQKPILKLTNADYNENGLSDLLAQYGQAYDINIDIFNALQHTITGWPGGKPNADDSHRPERAHPAQKRILLFSPHPDDDIISMGGTMQRLVDQGHQVHVAYQTSGNIAVADAEAFRFIEFVQDFNTLWDTKNPKTNKIYKEIKQYIANSENNHDIDPDALRYVKGLIREGEAKATCRYVGVPDSNVHFLKLPFYETGKIQKAPLGKKDIEIVANIIDTVKPHQIYAAGDLADPHGTHKVCYIAILEALKLLKGKEYLNDCWLWAYKGAWAEWAIDQIEMAVPMSPDQVLKKRFGIFKHQSQKDGVMFQGNDQREFWQRAEDRNRETANLYNRLGLAEYEAMEAFVRVNY
jgi:glucosamine-6-phosphate deaminase